MNLRFLFPILFLLALLAVSGAFAVLATAVVFGLAILPFVLLAAMPFIAIANSGKGRKHQKRTQRKAGQQVQVLHPTTQPRDARLVELDNAISKLGERARHLNGTPVAGTVESICLNADRSRKYFERKPELLRQHGHSLSVILTSASSVLAAYGELAQVETDYVRPTLNRLEAEVLPKLDAALARFYEQLLDDDVVNIEVAMRTLEDTLALEGVA